MELLAPGVFAAEPELLEDGVKDYIVSQILKLSPVLVVVELQHAASKPRVSQSSDLTRCL